MSNGGPKEREVSHMGEFLAQIATFFGGVMGGVIGFVFIAAVGVLLVLPYIMMTWRKPRRHRGDTDPLAPVDDPRY